MWQPRFLVSQYFLSLGLDVDGLLPEARIPVSGTELFTRQRIHRRLWAKNTPYNSQKQLQCRDGGIPMS